MSLWSRLFSGFSGGDKSAPQQDAEADRPGLSPIDMLNFGMVQPYIRKAYEYHYNCSLLCDIDITLIQETFRNGIAIQPKFVLKCRMCGHEIQEKAQKCPSCASNQLDTPLWAQQRFFEHLDGMSFIDRANYSGQTLQEVCENAAHHLHVADNAYLLAVKTYNFHDDGSVKEAFVKEVLSLDPRWVEKVFDSRGRPGGRHRLCLAHRENLLGKEVAECPDCGLPTHDVTYKVTSSTNGISYWVDDEIIHLTEFYPHPLYGTPPCFSIRLLVTAYMFAEGRIANYFEKGRPPGFVAIRTNNPKSIDETILKINKQLEKDPASTPYFPVPTGPGEGSGEFIKFVPFMPDPSPGMMAVKDELRRGVCSFFDIPPMVESDTAASGGLNNEGQQLALLNRRTKKDQTPFNSKGFPWLFKQFGITDLKLVLPMSEKNDEKLDLEVQLLKNQDAQQKQQLGFKIEGIEDGEYKFSQVPSEPKQPQVFASPQPIKPSGTMEGEPADKAAEEPFERVRYTGNECVDAVLFADALIDKAFTLSHVAAILKALFQVNVPDSFVTLSNSPEQAQEAMGSLIKAMTQPGGWSVSGVVDELQGRFEHASRDDLRRIVRTESERIAVKAHEMEATENDPPDTKYVWRGPRDWRTCPVHQEILASQPADGLSLVGLKALIASKASEHGLTVQDDWLIHPNQRGSFRRVF